MGGRAILILAAGEARRMGQLKQLLPWGEGTVLGAVVHTALASQVEQVVVVTGHRGPEVAAAAQAAGGGDPRLTVVHNPQAASGDMLSSVLTGLGVLGPEIGAFAVLLADQPLVQPASVDAVLRAHAAGQGPIVRAAHEGKPGHPVLFDLALRPEILSLQQTGGGLRALLSRHPERICPIAVADPGILVDLDTPEEYEAWRPKG